MNDFDPIVDEVRHIRDAHAARFNYDPQAIFRDIKEREKLSGRNYVSLADVAIEPKQGPVSSQSLPPSEVARSAKGVRAVSKKTASKKRMTA